MVMSDKVYDILKWIVLVALPAIATFYGVVAGIWGFPYGEQIVATITAIDTLLGAFIGVSGVKYQKNKTNT